MTKLQELSKAVDRLNQLEKDYIIQRTEVADLLEDLIENHKATDLSRLTKINRTTIYWLIKTWSTSANINSQNNGIKGTRIS